jgi:hypothetical protein
MSSTKFSDERIVKDKHTALFAEWDAPSLAMCWMTTTTRTTGVQTDHRYYTEDSKPCMFVADRGHSS